MADYLTTDAELQTVANAIRSKYGTTDPLVYPAGFISAIQGISTEYLSSNGDVVFMDYDGTIVATKTKNEISAMSSDLDLPSNPTHEGLTAQGWNWTVARLKAQLAAMNGQKIFVGQTYTITNGETEI